MHNLPEFGGEKTLIIIFLSSQKEREETLFSRSQTMIGRTASAESSLSAGFNLLTFPVNTISPDHRAASPHLSTGSDRAGWPWSSPARGSTPSPRSPWPPPTGRGGWSLWNKDTEIEIFWVRYLLQSGLVLVMIPWWSIAKLSSDPEMEYLHTSPYWGEQSLSVAATSRMKSSILPSSSWAEYSSSLHWGMNSLMSSTTTSISRLRYGKYKLGDR